MDIGGDDGGVCMGPAIVEIAKGLPPQWEPGGKGPRPGLKNNTNLVKMQ